MERSTCCVCADGSSLTERLVLHSFPITYSPTNKSLCSDKTTDIHWGACNRCGSVQLMNLIDPLILYERPHSDSSQSALWRRHHSLFSEFISTSLTGKENIIEIGGSSGNLATLLQTKVTSYSIMDISKYEISASLKINYIQANCETCVFKPDDTLILSHVFEHLYRPFEFIKNCSQQKVRDIYISNPVMKTNGDFIPIDIEHTYFSDDIDVQNMFERGHYTLVSKFFFENHSYFFHFRYDPAAQPTEILRPERTDDIIKLFEMRQKMIEKLTLEGEVFIAPSGQFGQLFYYYTKYDKIICFLDNDKDKQGYRVYGTPHMTHPFEKLRNLESPRVIVFTRHYSDEIISQINDINPTSKVFKV